MAPWKLLSLGTSRGSVKFALFTRVVDYTVTLSKDNKAGLP